VGVTVGLLSAQADDFNSLTGQFQFSAGQQKAVLSTLIKGDAVPEPDETATLSFSSAYASLARTTALLTILNDDWPRVTVTNVSVLEGNSGRTNAAFRITLSTKAPFPVEILFRTIPGTASANLDFIPREGWVRFEANEDVKTVFVPVIGDLAYELAETAAFVLLDKTNAELASAQGILTIRNDDLPPAPVLTVTALSNGGLRLDFDTINGATYDLQTRTNLTLDAWKLFPTSVTGSGAPGSLILPPPASAETYYRLQAQ